MKLTDAIANCNEEAEVYAELMESVEGRNTTTECQAYDAYKILRDKYKQLAEWLEELQERRAKDAD